MFAWLPHHDPSGIWQHKMCAVGGALNAIARRNPAHEDRGSRLDALPADRFPSVRQVAPHLAADYSREHFSATLQHLIRHDES